MIPRRAVVITLARTPERLELCRARWFDLPMELEVFPAIDGQLHFARLGPRRAAEEGCVASHLEVLSRMDGPVLVLEDDAMPRDLSPLWVEPPVHWRIARLGGLWRTPYRRRGWHPGPAHGSHAYLAATPAETAANLSSMHAELSAMKDLNSVTPVMDLLLNRLSNAWVWGEDAVEQDYRMPSTTSGLGRG